MKTPQSHCGRLFQGPDSENAIKERIKKSKNQLYRWCRGPVEPSLDETQINFAYQSVREYLECQSVKEKLYNYPPGSGAVDTLHNLLLAQIRYKEPSKTSKNLCLKVIKVRREHVPDRAPYNFLSCLQSVLDRQLQRSLEQDEYHSIGLDDPAFKLHNVIASKWRDDFATRQVEFCNIQTPLHSMTRLGDYDFPM